MDTKRSIKNRIKPRKSTAQKCEDKIHVINKLVQIKLNINVQQVCEIRNKTKESIKKSIKLNLSGVCMSPAVSASKKVIKIQGTEKKSFKIFNDSLEKSAYIQIGIDSSNCPVQFSRLCAVIKPKSSISVDVRLNLNLFVSEYFHKTVYISVLNHEPLKLDVYSCFHMDYDIENIECMKHFLETLEGPCKNIHHEDECSEDELSELTDMYISNALEEYDKSKNNLVTALWESFFMVNIENYLTIQPQYLELDRYFYRKEFLVKNNVNVKLFIIWNKDSLNKISIEPSSAIVNAYSTAIFSVEFAFDEQENFHTVELACSVYYGDKEVSVNLNQGKYEKRTQRLEFFLPYSCSMKFCAHSFSNGHSWITQYEIYQEQFTFQFLLNNNKQTSMAYSSILIKNCGNLPLHYSIKKVKNKFFAFETNPNCNYIRSNKDDQDNFHIIYAHLVLKEALPGSHLKQTFLLCLNTDDMYNKTNIFEVHYKNSLDMTIPYWLIAEKNVFPEECEPFQEEQDLSFNNAATAKGSLKSKSTMKSLPEAKSAIKAPQDGKSMMKSIVSAKDDGKKLETSKISPFPGEIVPFLESEDLFNEMKPICWNNNIREYFVVTFPPIHPTCSTIVNLPLYNSSQHIIFYEFEEVRLFIY